ncbi:hypothetical protein K438DRAFT_1800207 [Mycena galopus ATCC 62051]|nr:hypothetical protein K438DRAFT_1800207 [Mycena galopus ATCC 62051]
MSSSVNLMTLAPELQLYIISHLRLPDKCCLRLVCQIFNKLLILDLPMEQLRVARKKNTIFLVQDAKEGELGFTPFIIKRVRKVPGDSAQYEPRILLDIYYPLFMCNGEEDEEEQENELQIHIHMKTLSLGKKKKKKSSESTRLNKSINYDLLRGKLLQASAGLLRTRFGCPECGNSRSVCPGCGGFGERFSELFTGCGWPMPCPVCIGYGVAYTAKDIQDEQEELDKLWEEIDEMLAEDKVAGKA